MSTNFLGKQLDFDDVLIAPKRSFQLSRKDIKVERDFKFYHSDRVWEGCPIICSPMPYLATKATATALTEENIITCLHKFIDYTTTPELIKHNPDHVWLTTGILDNDILKIKDVSDCLEFQPNICIDAANGYSDFMIEQCSKIRGLFPLSIIMAGNVCSGTMVEELIMYGKVDIVKVGIGPSKLCATRKVTGVGRPQLSAIMECADAAHGLKNGDKKLGLICSDGGVKEYGDICKAFCAGADFVMCASIFNGVDECDGEWKYDGTYDEIDNQGNAWKYPGDIKISVPKEALKVYGLSSYEAQNKHYGGSKDYRASEGECYRVPYKGPIKDIIKEIKGGLRSCGTYINAPTIKDFSKCGSFYEVGRQK